MYTYLEEKSKSSMMSIQELIAENLRKAILASRQPANKKKAGRPPKVDEPFLEYFSRKR
jgi:hypothetical protein